VGLLSYKKTKERRNKEGEPGRKVRNKNPSETMDYYVNMVLKKAIDTMLN